MSGAEQLAKGSIKEALVDPAGSAKELLARLEAAIRHGTLPEGVRMPTEREIAEMSGLARSTVRSALAGLQQKGLITRRVGRGTFVSSPLLATQPTLSEVGTPRLVTPTELMEFRFMTEPSLAEHLVLSASDQALKDLKDFVLQSRSPADWRETEHADSEFHRRMFCASGNPLFVGVSNLVLSARQSPTWLLLKERRFDWERWRRYQEEHEAIADALCARDSVLAQRLIRSHLMGVSQRFEI